MVTCDSLSLRKTMHLKRLGTGKVQELFLPCGSTTGNKGTAICQPVNASKYFWEYWFKLIQENTQ